MKKLLIAPFAFALFFAACKKNNDNCSTTQASLAGSYKLLKITEQIGTAGEQDVTSQNLEVCERDDVLSLNSNGTYTYTDAGTVCNPSGNDSGIWSLSGNNIIQDGDTSQVFSYDCSTLVTGSSETFQGITYTYKAYMKKQ